MKEKEQDGQRSGPWSFRYGLLSSWGLVEAKLWLGADICRILSWILPTSLSEKIKKHSIINSCKSS